MTSTAEDARQDRDVTRRPAAGIAIDPLYLEHLRTMRGMYRARLAELVGVELFDRPRFTRVTAGREPPDARTLRALARVLAVPAGELARDDGSGLLDVPALRRRLKRLGWTQDELAARVARAGRSRDSMAKI